VAYPDRHAGTGLYAFVEGGPALSERILRDFMGDGDGLKPPEHLQVTEELPRRSSGEIRSEILQLVAMNQVDLIDALVASDRERVLIQRILADRGNLLGRLAF
jgi:acyl-coenzyme A synthetase/AMP-(fatty) acid ligase